MGLRNRRGFSGLSLSRRSPLPPTLDVMIFALETDKWTLAAFESEAIADREASNKETDFV